MNGLTLYEKICIATKEETNIHQDQSFYTQEVHMAHLEYKPLLTF